MFKKILQVRLPVLSKMMIALLDLRKIGIPVVFSVLLTACDPMISIEGSFWPAWIICILAGLATGIVLMWQLVRHQLAQYLGSPLLIVPSLWALCTFVIWLLFYST
ncbi:MAG: YtcA family lipoprotein [Methylococcaceae bacterium]|jgi:YtcA family